MISPTIEEIHKWCDKNNIPVNNQANYNQDGYSDNNDNEMYVAFTGEEQRRYAFYVDEHTIRLGELKMGDDGNIYLDFFMGLNRSQTNFETFGRWLLQNTKFSILPIMEGEY